MVLQLGEAVFRAVWPETYIKQFIMAILAVVAIRAISQGRKTTRDRDLHARVVLVTGGFTPLGLTLLESLAKRGAHIIALSPHPITSTRTETFISLLRATTSNESIYAEECDLQSPESIRAFCTRFLTGENQRIDAILFAHEYRGLGSLWSKNAREAIQDARETASLATFLIVTLLLPALLVAPVERDIRIVNVVNPFYAAAAPSFDAMKAAYSGLNKPTQKPLLLSEGTRALRSAVFTRHLQRVLDALPSAQIPDPKNKNAAPTTQRSNIVAVSVCPGISRADTMSPFIVGQNDSLMTESTTKRERWGLVLYILLQPLLRLFTKSTTAALESVLHVLFLPTPFKVFAGSTDDAQPEGQEPTKKPKPKSMIEEEDEPEELLKPGALYRECAVVKLAVPAPVEPEVVPSTDDTPEKKTEAEGEGDPLTSLPDDGELGGEVAGRFVWESLEVGLRAWEKDNPNPLPTEAQGEETKEKGKGKTKAKGKSPLSKEL